MKRNYIQPQVETLALNAEGAMMTGSNVHNSRPQNDHADNLFSAGTESWSSEAWSSDEE